MNHHVWPLLFALAIAASASETPPADPVVRVEVMFTSDIHGHIGQDRATFLNPEFPPPLGGGATVATYVARVRREAAQAGRRVLLLDSGDIFQGTPLAAKTRGGAIIEWMNRMGYDAATLGNHDFDLGRDNAERLAGLAEFPMLVGNLVDRATGAAPPWLKDRLDLEVEGVRIVLLGYITESTVEMAFEKNIAGLEFRPIIDVLPGAVERARADGADVVLVLLHHGLPYRLDTETEYRKMLEREARGELRRPGMDAMDLARAVRGIDAIFAGHTHQGYDRPWQDPVTHTIVFQPYANGSSLGHVTLMIDRASRGLIGYETHFDRGALLTLSEDEVWPDAEEARIIDRQVAEAEAGLDVVVGRTRVALESGPADHSLIGFVMADAFREELGTDFAIQNTGGVRGTIPAGPIRERDLMTVAPFGNQMVVARIPGGVLRGLIEDKLAGRGGGAFISGGRVRYDLSRPDGDRLVEFQIGGEPVDTLKTYTVALTDYLAEGNSGMGRLLDLPAESFMPAGFTDREVLTRWVRRLGTIEPTNDGRWTRVRAGRP
jgi:2',3'-cyclic-nucleotide 2'-phosphodiesterase (5'-nucleotidase family)